MTNALAYMLRTNRRDVVPLLTESVPPEVTPDNFGPVIVVFRESKRLTFFDGRQAVRSFQDRDGNGRIPDPTRDLQHRHDAAGSMVDPAARFGLGPREKPIPPGPGNPLGTRWMGTTAPLVGIHGTPDAASIGYSASHGCIRMRVPDAEALFSEVDIGTPVLIVAT